MTDIELYDAIGKYINRYHRRDWFYTGLLKDFQHDLWERMRGKEVNVSYIKQRCFHYPLNAVRYLYYKRTRDFSAREVVLLNEDGTYVDIPDYPFEYEISAKPPKTTRTRKTQARLLVTYITGAKEEFESVKALAKSINVNRNSIYHRVGKPLFPTQTGRKMSHIRLIEYADNKPI